MKKSIKITSAMFLAVTAIAPVVASADTVSSELKTGLYIQGVDSSEYIDLASLSRADQKKAIKKAIRALVKERTVIGVNVDGTATEFTLDIDSNESAEVDEKTLTAEEVLADEKFDFIKETPGFNPKPTLSKASIKSIDTQDGTSSLDLTQLVDLELTGSGNYDDVVFSFSGTNIYADLDGDGPLAPVEIGKINVSGAQGVAIVNNELVFDLAVAADATTELTITDLNGSILSEITFVLDVEEEEDGE